MLGSVRAARWPVYPRKARLLRTASYTAGTGRRTSASAGPLRASRKRSRKLERGDTITYGVIDPSAYSNQSGPSHAERMATEGVLFRKADNNRIGGWDMVRDRLCGIEGDPTRTTASVRLCGTCSATCVHIIRTLPALQHDLTTRKTATRTAKTTPRTPFGTALCPAPGVGLSLSPRWKATVKLLQNATMNDLWEAHERDDDYLFDQPLTYR
jgi:hypothetical protein